MLYQIQTKYRDEARPRAGLIRVREFTMKDAYSFHADEASLKSYYEKAHKAYERIFKRIGLKNCISIKSDSGMMGGKVSHEFMALAESGEDTVFISPDGKYRANREIATAAWKYKKSEPLELEKVNTPGKKTIEEVAEFLNVKPENTGKAVFYKDSENKLILVMIRGDFEVNENKLQNYLRDPGLTFAPDELIRECGAEPGYASPLGVDHTNVRVIADQSIEGSSNLVVGANDVDFHYRNFNMQRDLLNAEVVDIATVREGDPCPETGLPLQMKRGIEVGNIFQLGTKYSEAMNCTFLDENGKAKPVIMGCYGIGVGRSMASVIEQEHDEYGPVWPVTIAPFHVQICALNPKKENVREVSENLYREMRGLGIEVLYDDRGEKAGFMFSDADLTGVPFRIVVSPKTVKENQVEFKRRGERDGELWGAGEAAVKVKSTIEKEFARYNDCPE
jgi:prolyl-tRNA synthetase